MAIGDIGHFHGGIYVLFFDILTKFPFLLISCIALVLTIITNCSNPSSILILPHKSPFQKTPHLVLQEIKKIPAKMPLTLSHCLPTDAPELARASHAIWSPIPRNKVAFGGVPASKMLKMYEKDFHDGMTVEKQYKLPQQKHYLKVTDDATGEIAASGVWVYLPEGYCTEDDEEVVMGPLPEGANEELMREFCKMTGSLRVEHPGRHEAHWCE